MVHDLHTQEKALIENAIIVVAAATQLYMF